MCIRREVVRKEVAMPGGGGDEPRTCGPEYGHICLFPCHAGRFVWLWLVPGYSTCRLKDAAAFKVQHQGFVLNFGPPMNQLSFLSALSPGSQLAFQVFLNHWCCQSFCGWTKSCTTLKPWETIVSWYLQGNHPSRVSVVHDFVHPQFAQQKVSSGLARCLRVCG